MTVTYNDFVKFDICTGTVLEAAMHPDADKLLVLKVDIGTETRQIVAGIKKHYSPENMVGKNIVVITNLEKRLIRGVESNGMLLAAGNGEILSLFIPSPKTTTIL